jgi:hypothetical protein
MATSSSSLAASIAQIMPLLPGSAPSTQNGKTVAVSHFNAMQVLQGQPLYNELKESELCRIETFQVFGRYVAEMARSSKGSYLMRDTCNQYVSGLKSLAIARFPKNEIWITEKIWYSQLRANIESNVSLQHLL